VRRQVAVENLGAMPSDAPTCRASAEASGNGERSSRAGLVSSCRRSAAEVHADAAEHAQGAVEAFSGVALLQQGGHVRVAFIAQRRLDRIAAADHLLRGSRARSTDSPVRCSFEQRMFESNARMLLVCCSFAPRTRGWIVPIGGAENKENDRHILERFIRVSGGENADIVVIPTASRVHETGPRYEKVFKELGAAQVTVMDFDTRRDCQEAGRLRRIEEATGIFFTGGNQLRLTTLLGGTPVAKLIRVRNAHGVTVGGTSAGASILSEHMIAFGDEGSSVISGSVRLAPGLGLTNRFIIDQHFRQRDRLGRLITALAYNPFAVGIGLDEDTAAFIGPDETIEVEGSGGVTVVDASDVSYSSIGDVGEGQPVCMLGLKLHILVAGATFNLHTATGGRRWAGPGKRIT
jgi:cyanophycinase